MIHKLETIVDIVKRAGFGNMSINTITIYYEYYAKYRYYISSGANKMEAYEWTACDVGIGIRVIMKAVKVCQEIEDCK